MKLAQPTDASEIAFGLLAYGIVLMPLALGLGFILGLGVGSFWPAGAQPAVFAPVCGLLMWLGAMWLVVQRCRKIAAQWGEERRGRSAIRVVEWIAVGTTLLFSWAGDSGLNEVRVFFAVLMLLLLLCHVTTYYVLSYRPRTNEMMVWAAMSVALLIELFRNAG